jgi:MATE family multidrug resistance protein
MAHQDEVQTLAPARSSLAAGILFITFVAFSMAACVQVGNHLGAGDAEGARASAAAAVAIAPCAWALAAPALLQPDCQALLIRMFSDPSQEGDARLALCLRHMFELVALLILWDGVQTIMSGVVQALGKQHHGALINAIAFYVFAVPLALDLAFRQGLGAEGLYLGMVVGPIIQSASYATLLCTTNWGKQAR